MPWSAQLHAPGIAACGIVLFAAYLIGSTPTAYLITKAFRGLDITAEGSGNAGAMNVLRVTGSRAVFALTAIVDVLKGLLPVLAGLYAVSHWIAHPLGVAWGISEFGGFPHITPSVAYAQCAFAGAVVGHNYSIWMALIKRRFTRTGQGIATGAGALLAYDWRYLAAALAVGLVASALTHRTRIGQAAAAVTLPVAALALGSPDWSFALLIGLIAYAAIHRQFLALLRKTRSHGGPEERHP